jgi:hypothetical protein
MAKMVYDKIVPCSFLVLIAFPASSIVVYDGKLTITLLRCFETYFIQP